MQDKSEMVSDGDSEKTHISDVPAQGVPVGTQIIGTYEISKLIAAGGMGEVYRGTNIHTNQSVAIKIVLADLAEDETILSLFQREATILGDLNHDAIVRYHIFTKDPILKRACLVMEYVEGRPLGDIFAQAPLPEDEVRQLLSRLAPGLQKAHDLGVVHRDLSPDNVIVQDGMISHAKIIDFGIAKSGTETKHGKTVLGDRFAGKYSYVSPEQLFLYKGIVTGKSDIYSLGLVAVAALQGHPLEMGENIPEAMEKRSTVPDLSGVPEGIRPLLAWLLQPDPANRPDSMATVAAALQDPSLIPALDPGMEAGAQPGAPAAGTDPQAVTSQPVTSQPPTGWDFDTPAPAQPQGTTPPGGLSAPPVDPFAKGRGMNPDATQIAMPGTLAPTSMPPQAPVSTPPQPGPGTSVPPQTPAGDDDLPPSARSDEDSPFGGAPAATPETRPAPQSAPEPKKKSALVPILAVLLLAGAGGGAYLSGMFDPAPTGQEMAAAPPPPPAPPAPQAEAPAEETPPPPAPAAQPDPPEPAQPSIAAVGTQVLQGAVFEPAPEVTDSTCTDSDLECIARMVRWLEDYSLPSCTHLNVLSASADSIDLEGFGTTATPFIRLLTDFQGTYGIDPDIGVRLVDERQCPAVTFLNGMADSSALQPRLRLDKDVLEYGGAIAGTISDVGDRDLWLVLVDHRGRFYNLTGLVSELPNGDRRFGIQLSGGSENAPPTPQMMLALTSDTPLETIDTATNRIEDITQLVRAEISQKNISAAVSAGYFRFENQ